LARRVNGLAETHGANIVTKVIKTSIVALLTGFVLTTTSSAFAQTPAPEASNFYDLIAAELGAGGGLTANEVAKRASRTSPVTRARREELVAAAARVDEAAFGYIPRVSVSAGYTRLSDTGNGNAGNIVAAPGAPAGPIASGTTLVNAPLAFDTPLNQNTFQASISVPLSDYFFRVGPTHESAKYGETAAKERLLAEKLKVAADARISYYDWVRARLSVIVAEQALAQAEAHLADANKGLSAGTLSQADVLRIESEVARNELLVTSSKNLSSLTEEQVRTAMHDERKTGYRIGEDVRQTAPSIGPGRLEDFFAEAQRSRPELRAFDAEHGAQERATAAERAGYVPRLEVFGNATYANPNSRIFPQEEEFRGSWEAGVQATWLISDIPSTGARVRGSEAAARAIQAERASLSDQIRLQVMSAFNDRAEARVAEKTTIRRLTASEESYRTRRLLFQNGRATTVELLDAEIELTRARLEAVNARIDARVAEVRLAYAVGRPDRQ
jgi:outer membrane protein TolC